MVSTRRSPGRPIWHRLRRDRTAVISGVTITLLILTAAAAPVIEKVYGIGPGDFFADGLDRYGMPLGVAGGVSVTHWLGIEPNLGRDLFIHLVYGLRTSLGIAFGSALLTTTLGILAGVLGGYLGGWVDALLTWLTDVTLALPFLVFTLAVIRPLELHFYGPRDPVPGWFRVALMMLLFGAFGWGGTARLVRGQVLSLRERGYIEAARVQGARVGRMLFREILPNLSAPILVALSISIPAYVTVEAALSFLGVGVLEPTPDLGRMIYRGLDYLQTDPGYVLLPGLTIFLVVLAFNRLGDALRDAFDPKTPW